VSILPTASVSVEQISSNEQMIKTVQALKTCFITHQWILIRTPVPLSHTITFLPWLSISNEWFYINYAHYLNLTISANFPVPLTYTLYVIMLIRQLPSRVVTLQTQISASDQSWLGLTTDKRLGGTFRNLTVSPLAKSRWSIFSDFVGC